MSDTPRTDAEEAKKLGGWSFARTLERELSAVTRERDEAHAALKEKGEYGYSQFVVDALSKERDAFRAEVERLTGCLKRANEQAEEFERKWYLRGDEVERLRAAIKGQASLLPPLPTAPPGSYARGYDSGMRDTITAISAALQEPTP